jgi:glycosidase
MEEQVDLPVSHRGDMVCMLTTRLLTDRFAPQVEGAACNTDDRVYCGGTWKTIVDKLDYVQGMGYDAIWISPTAQNIEGYTQYGEAYHVSGSAVTS